MCHLILGDTKDILTMFVRKKKYPSGNIGVIVVEKIGGKMKELTAIGVAYNEGEVENLVIEAKEWISRENSRRTFIRNSSFPLRMEHHSGRNVAQGI